MESTRIMRPRMCDLAHCQAAQPPRFVRFPPIIAVGCLFFAGCLVAQADTDSVQLVVLGITQDGGFPHAGCKRDCCQAVWDRPELHRSPTCMGLVDRRTHQRWLLECTPMFAGQLARLDRFAAPPHPPGLDGILLTHAHIGHYAGLLQLGREVMGTRQVPVYAMPRMRQFLMENGPWSQLVALSNIQLRELQADRPVQLNRRIQVTPLLVPHRDEFSETVAFIIAGPQRRVLFLPDIDKWDRWDRSVERVVRSVDVALLDGTFYANGEIPNRDMSEIPHPFIAESVARFASLPASERAKIRFIHLNHTNPALQTSSAAAREIVAAGFSLAREGDVIDL